MKPSNLLKYLFVGLSVVWYLILYYYIERSQFLYLMSGVSVLGFSYFYWIAKQSFGAKEIIVLAILFRALFLAGTPNLSDDYYRFYWDGAINLEGVNPYELTPTHYIETNKENANERLIEVYPFLNSKEYYSVYPPMNQLFFKTAVFFAQGDLQATVFFLKLFIFLFDIALVFLLVQFLRKLLLPVSLAQIYALNPLVIIELNGNLHFEGVMLFFLISGIYFIWNKRLVYAALAIAISIGIKVLPLLLLPLFLPFLGVIKSLKLYLGIILFIFLVSLPFATPQVFFNFSESINLYFQSFEFNSSVYYFSKQISIGITGFKSPIVGIILPILTFLFVFTFTLYLWVKKPLLKEARIDVILFMKCSAFCLAFYYLLASTVHPWYVINVVVFSVFVLNRAFVVWSILIFLSYFAYSDFVLDYAPQQDFNSYSVYYLLILFQYSIVLFIFIFDLSKKSKNL